MIADELLPVARYRFEFRPDGDMSLPDYAGSLLRGQFGAALRRTVCMTGDKQCGRCPLYRSCPYPTIYENPPQPEHALQKFSSVPNPYVIEPPAYGTRRVATNETLTFHVVLFGSAIGQLPLIVHALQRAFTLGIGRDRIPAVLAEVSVETASGYESVWDPDEQRIVPHRAGLTVPAHFPAVEEITLLIDTPLRLQHQGRPLHPGVLTPRPLITALTRRMSLLFELHSGRPGFVAEPRAVAEAAASLEDEKSLRWLDWTRYSSRQQQEMTLGGVVGRWRLAGDLALVLPWLWLGQWLHGGKGAVMGMGSYRLEWPAPGGA